jgi:hypothetical protein
MKDMSWKFTLVALRSSDAWWAGASTINGVAGTILATVAGFAAFSRVIPESWSALVALDSDNVGRTEALAG